MHRRILRDDWRRYLSNLNPANTSALFKYFAKEDGRQPRVGPSPCLVSVRDLSRRHVFGDADTCALLADFFAFRYSAASATEDLMQQPSSAPPTDTNSTKLSKTNAPTRHRRKQQNRAPKPRVRETSRPKYRAATIGTFEDFREVDVLKASRMMAIAKARDPDGVATEKVQGSPS